MNNSPNVEWALELLERVHPEATRIIQQRLEERPNIGWVEDLKEAADVVDKTIKLDDLYCQDLANRLRLYACEIIGVNTFLDS